MKDDLIGVFGVGSRITYFILLYNNLIGKAFEIKL